MGSTVIVIHAPKEQELKTMDELGEKLKDPGKQLLPFYMNW